MQSIDGASEIQQFTAEGDFSSLFSISIADMNSSPQPHKHHPHAHQLQQQQQQQQQHHLQQPRQQYHHQHQHVQRQHPHNDHPHFHHQHHAPQLLPQPLVPPSAQPLSFPQFPVTQQLFQQTHQFHLFQQEQQQRRMPPQQVHLGQDKSLATLVNSDLSARIVPLPAGGGGVAGGGAGVPPFLARVNFNLDVNQSIQGGGGDGLEEEEEDAVQCDEGSESRLHTWSRGDEKSAIKEPFWKPLDVDYRNSKRCTEKLLEPSDGREDLRMSIDVNNADDGRDAANNYKLFSELEAICKPASSGGGGGSRFGGGNGYHKTAASFSALVDSNPPPTAVAERSELLPDGEPCTVHAADEGSNAASEEEAAQAAPKSNKSGGGGGTSRKRKRKQQLISVARFLESLVSRLMEHQEGLHRKFLEVLERRDEERMNREEMWRQHETAKASREATARAQEQALASNREAAIISFLEKITGERLSLPTVAQFQDDLQQKETTLEHLELSVTQTAAAGGGGSTVDGGATTSAIQGLVNGNRWPKAEVQALIQVRSNLERRFQEPGLRGPLWEEVSAAMAAMGYHRSAKRCKEKWENINKYFRRSKDSDNERPRESKPCPYFQQLDKFYSKTTTGEPPPASAVPATTLHNAAIAVSSSQTEMFDPLRGMDPTTLGFQDKPEDEDEDEDEDDDEIEVSHIGAVRRRGLSQAGNDVGVFDEQEEEEGDRGRRRRRRGRRSGEPGRGRQGLKPHDGRREIKPRRGAHR